MQFASNIKKLREQIKLSQKDIADYLGVTRQAVASYECEKREPDYQTLIKLADLFGVTVDYLLGRSPSKNITGYEEEYHEEIPCICKINFIDPILLKWIEDENNIQYIRLAKDIQKMKIPLQSVMSIKSVQDGT